MFNQNSTTTNSPPAPTAPAHQKLEFIRDRLRFIARSITAHEGRLLDYQTADEITRALVLAQRELDDMRLKIAVWQRRAGQP